ncbi:MAG: hypothetical protein GXP30_13345 [Verrucomicrobia bacterium]|nr:hypothetical protein [Verrucomicrobiota bacterium]
MTDSENMDEPWKLVLVKAKALTGYSLDDEQILQEASETLLACSQEVVTEFYDVLFEYELTAEIFTKLNQDRAVREKTLLQWYESLVNGQYDDQFWTWHWLVGLIHIQHDVEHVYVMSMFNRLQTIVTKKAFESFEEASAEKVILAFCRIMGCLAALVVESYHQEYLSAVNTAGLKGTVLKRMISMEVKDKIQEYRHILETHANNQANNQANNP